MRRRTIDFRRIVPHGGSQASAFEEFCCQLARRTEVAPAGSEFIRYRGAGGDAGVECVWRLADRQEWGWQAKFVFTFDDLRRSIDSSFGAAVRYHPIARYIICVPFDLPGPTGRRGTSARGRFETYRRELMQRAEVRVELWDASTLIDRLVDVDPDGGRRRFWFDEQVLTDAWFDTHVLQAIKLAGPRYSPALNLETPLGRAFQGLALTDKWRQSVRTFLDAATKLATNLWDTFYFRRQDLGDQAERIIAAAFAVRESLYRVAEALKALLGYRAGEFDLEPLHEALRDSRSHAVACRAMAGETLGVPEEFQEAESVVAGLASPVGQATQAIRFAEKLSAWLGSPEVRAAVSGRLLVTGSAGTGKTHSICDAARERSRSHLPSILCFGSQFHRSDPWDAVRTILGLNGTWSRDALLDAMDAAGESAGSPVLVFVDALNETDPRRYWLSGLPSLIAPLASRRWVRLCVSCRSTYEPFSIPADVDLTRHEHIGFSSRIDACRSFFEYYGLESPQWQLLHPGFSNPLFLKLVCQSLRAAREIRLPAGWVSLHRAIQEILSEIGRRFAQTYEDHPGARRVQQGLAAFVRQCIAERRTWLSYTEAEEVVDAVVPPSLIGASVFRWLIHEGFLTVVPNNRSANDDLTDQVRFAYELLGEHLVAHHFLAGASKVDILKAAQSGGWLESLVSTSGSAGLHRGLLEALSAQLGEEHALELPDLLCLEDRQSLLPVWVESLIWRMPESITPAVAEVLKEAFERPDCRAKALDVALRVAIRPGERSVLEGLHSWLKRQPLPSRDAHWCWYLHEGYERAGSSVQLLLEPPALSGAVPYHRAIAHRWLRLLCWFFAAADRRVRDCATKTAVVISECDPGAWVELLTQFVHLDDDYVIERCLVAAYGCLLRSEDKQALRQLAPIAHEYLSSEIDEDASRNILVREHALCLIQLARQHGVCLDDAGDDVGLSPPERANRFQDSATGTELFGAKGKTIGLQQVYASFRGGPFRQALQQRMGQWLSIMPEDGAHRWILNQVATLGWSEALHGPYDEAMILRYGDGESRPDWAERIGEKYQWIGLYRLIGSLADSAHAVEGDESDRTRVTDTLKALDLRNIDPSDVWTGAPASATPAWWSPVAYDIAQGESDHAWLSHEDNPLSGAIYGPLVDRSGKSWIILFILQRWNLLRYVIDGRAATLWTRSFLVKRDDLEAAWKALRDYTQSPEVRIPHYILQTNPDLPQEPELSHWYMGEYPYGPSFPGGGGTWLSPVTKTGSVLSRLSPTSNRLLLNHLGDGSLVYQEITLWNIPGRIFFNNLLDWDRTNGYRSANGQQCFVDPSVRERGPMALLVGTDYLWEFLERWDMEVIWLARFTKTVNNSFDVSKNRTVLYGRLDVPNRQVRPAADPQPMTLAWRQEYVYWEAT